MADHTTNALLGLCSSLTDIVSPGVSAQDPLAQQELRMAVRYLEFLRQRVEHLHQRARLELRHNRDLAITLHGLTTTDERLPDLITSADALLASPEATITDLSACGQALLRGTCEVIREADGSDSQGAVELAVVDAAAMSTGFERSWYLPLGMDHFADEVAALETYLGPTVASRADQHV